jgi:anti-sigma B factor antagonist
MNLRVASEIARGRALLRLQGELDLASVPEAETALMRLEHDPNTATIVLDLRRLAFMDSTGLRFVLAADARANRTDRRLVIVRGPESVHRVFHLARLEDRLEFADSADAIGGADG